MEIVLFILLGACAGLLSGLLGIGGGIVIVPALCVIFKLYHAFPQNAILHMAAGTSFAIMIFTTLSTIRAYHQKKLINFPLVLKFLPGLISGLIIGSFISMILPVHVLSYIFSIFLIFMAYKMAFKQKKSSPSKSKNKHDIWMLILVSVGTGMLSSFFGIGGGILMIPFFMAQGLSTNNASGTSATCSLPLAIIGMLSLTIAGWHQIHEPFATGFIYWAAVIPAAFASVLFVPLGTHFAVKAPELLLRRVLAVILLVSAFYV
jgi:uncharacterized protein